MKRMNPILTGTGLAALVLMALIHTVAEAHKPVTSRYTYNDDVYPILKDRCGRCHVGAGAAPMSLLTYQEALPWAESIHEEVTRERMPPWFADAGTSRSEFSLTAREMDTLMTWATGGAPEGRPDHRPAPPPPGVAWPLGPPDFVVSIPGHTLREDRQDLISDDHVPTGLHETRWLRAIDIRPEMPALVRSATVAIESPGANESVLLLWQPGDAPPASPAGAFKLSADSRLRIRIRYRRPWQAVTGALSDRSSVGLYFAKPSAASQEIRDLQLEANPAGEAGRRLTARVPGKIKVLAVVPSLDRPYAAIDLQAFRPDGTRLQLLHLAHPRPEWDRRYWLDPPVDLPEGAILEATAVAERPDADLPYRTVARVAVLRLSIDFIAR